MLSDYNVEIIITFAKPDGALLPLVNESHHIYTCKFKYNINYLGTLSFQKVKWSWFRNMNCITYFTQGNRDSSRLSKECQHGALLQTAGLGGDKVFPGGHDQSGRQQTCALPASVSSQVSKQSGYLFYCNTFPGIGVFMIFIYSYLIISVESQIKMHVYKL